LRLIKQSDIYEASFEELDKFRKLCGKNNYFSEDYPDSPMQKGSVIVMNSGVAMNFQL
jgi:hypothetical protein